MSLMHQPFPAVYHFAWYLSSDTDEHVDIKGKYRCPDKRLEEFKRACDNNYEDPESEKVKLDYVVTCDGDIVETLASFEERLRRQDYTDYAVVLLEFGCVLDKYLDFIETHLRNHDSPYEITICKVPSYVHRSTHVEHMFKWDPRLHVEDSTWFHDYFVRCYIDDRSYCFLKLNKKGEEEPEGPYKVVPNAIDDEKRVMST